jgi:hypothetical protein
MLNGEVESWWHRILGRSISNWLHSPEAGRLCVDHARAIAVHPKARPDARRIRKCEPSTVHHSLDS